MRSEVDRAVVEAAAAYLNSEDTDIGYLFSGWAQAALPHAEEVTDIGVFGIEVGSRRLDDRPVDLRPQGDLLAMPGEKGMNLRHTPDPSCSAANLPFRAAAVTLAFVGVWKRLFDSGW